MAKKEVGKKPFYKNWRFWLIIGAIVCVIGLASLGSTKNKNLGNYIDKDAKQAYNELSESGYEVKFIFDRDNNGGFTQEKFQEYVLESISSESYAEMPFTVTKQSASGKTISLCVEYASALEAGESQKTREETLESKLSDIEAMTACDQYGKQNYRNFKLHSIVGEIAKYASDDDTWFFKYKVDADGHEQLTMECYVTGTTDNPIIKEFNIY